jgi:hypothetical protein
MDAIPATDTLKKLREKIDMVMMRSVPSIRSVAVSEATDAEEEPWPKH